MRKLAVIVFLVLGILINLIASISIYKDYQIKQNGVKVNSKVKLIKKNKSFDVPQIIYTLAYSYNDSLYFLEYNLGESDLKVNDSIEFYFNPRSNDMKFIQWMDIIAEAIMLDCFWVV